MTVRGKSRTFTRLVAVALAALPLLAAGCRLIDYPQSTLNPQSDYAWSIQHLLNQLVFWVVVAGFLMYSVLERTGRFWSLWALHFSWNFTMNGVFGLANSGRDLPGLIKPTVSGPVWLTGGATGPEASVLSIGFDLLLLFLLC